MRTVTMVLVVAGALRLGLIGFLGLDFIGSLFGSAPVVMSGLDRIVCSIVGIAAIYSIYILTKAVDNELVEK